MTRFHIVLQAINPAINAWRNYEIAISRDLFGQWLVEVSYGRIGAMGRNFRQAFVDEGDAFQFARSCLRRRRGSRRRIGVAYLITHTDGGLNWFQRDGTAL